MSQVCYINKAQCNDKVIKSKKEKLFEFHNK